MRIFLGLFFVFMLVIDQFQFALAIDQPSLFTKYMLEWRQKSEIAQDYLRKGEKEAKNGLQYRVCFNNRMASRYGVEAFEALIKAQQYSDADKELINIEDSLGRWRRLGNCSTASSLFIN